MTEIVTIDVTPEGIADVRLNRPDKYNSLNHEMFEAIVNAGQSLAKRSDVRVVVLSGNGRGFCSGLDMSIFETLGQKEIALESVALSMATKEDNQNVLGNQAQLPALVWKRLPVPVIAAIHGVAFGGGCQIALGADIRVIAPDAKMSIMEIKWGIIPDMGISQTLRDLVPIDVAKELTFTGRIISGEEAKDYGLATRVAEKPYEVAMELAREIAGKSPDAIRAGKQLFDETWHAGEGAGLELEEKLQLSLMDSFNQKEAVTSIFEKRVANYKHASTAN